MARPLHNFRHQKQATSPTMPARSDDASQTRRRDDTHLLPQPSLWKRFRERLALCPDTEPAQNVTRIVYVLLINAAITYVNGLGKVHVPSYVAPIGVVYILFSLASFAWMARVPVSQLRRVLYLIGDRGLLTLFLWSNGAWAAPFYMLYIWIDIGQPARFGRRHLLPCALFSVIGFGIVIFTNPYWISIRPLSFGLWFALLALPLYSNLFFKKQKYLSDQLAALATHDALTGLPNRRYLYDELASTISWSARHKRGFAVLFIDVDNFKRINDLRGHEVGDEALKGLARLLRQNVREEDCVTRLGGDEFVVVLKDVATRDTTHIAEKLRAYATWQDGDSDPVTVSIGVANFPGCGEDAETLVRNADMAMYQAKQKGKARIAICHGANTKDAKIVA